ncbi:MAG TPA: ATP-dependent 6-phosphofructokinase [Candidatus Dormibacteraeota bacterium]|nr:ATP-dependent 6-phosphofructokinase [Candidatus Dormibacteraeota bacterium]
MRIGILTGGGDAPGLNAAIRAVARPALASGDTVLGVRDGWKGMLGEGSLRELDLEEVDGVLARGGTFLGSSRTNPAKVEGGYDQVRGVFERHGLDALVAIGGDDTLGVAARLAEMKLPVVGVPKTMDNDLAVTEYCIGFDTAVGIVTESLDRLHTTADSHHRVIVVEVMGRDAGWVAVAGGMAGGAHALVIPEFEVGIDTIVDRLAARRARGHQYGIVVIAEGGRVPELDEGAADTTTDAFGHVQLAKRGLAEGLASLIETRARWETRSVVLGHLQRGGTPSAYDRVWASRVGHGAYTLVRDGRFGEMPIARAGEVAIVPIADVAVGGRTVPRELYDLAQTLS